MSEKRENKITAAPIKWQFGLPALFCTMLNVSLLLAYLRSFEDEWLVIQAAAIIASSTVIGFGVGWLARRTLEAVFWSVLGAVVAFLAISDVLFFHPSLRLAWPAVGTVAGAAVGGLEAGRPFRRTLVGLLAGGLVMGVHLTVLAALSADPPALMFAFEVACAALAGGLIGAFAEGVAWVECRIRTPRYAVPTFLVATAIVGSWLAPRIVPGW